MKKNIILWAKPGIRVKSLIKQKRVEGRRKNKNERQIDGQNAQRLTRDSRQHKTEDSRASEEKSYFSFSVIPLTRQRQT